MGEASLIQAVITAEAQGLLTKDEASTAIKNILGAYLS